MKNNGLLKYIVQITCILALSHAAQIYSLNIDIKNLFGTWYCLKDDKKYLSPLNGAICAETGWIENMYRFGEVDTEVVLKDGRQIYKKREESKRRIKQNATSELVFLLFNAFPNIDGIHVSKSPASPAVALTPVLIGQLLSEIEKLIGNQCYMLFDLSDEKEFNNLIREAKKAFKNPIYLNHEYQSLEEKLETLKKDKLTNIKDKENQASQISEYRKKIALLEKKYERESSQALAKYTQELLNANSEKLIGEMDKLLDICNHEIKISFASPDAHKIVDTIKTLLAKNKIPDAESFLQLILKSLLECGLLKLETLDLTLSKGPMYIGNNKYNIIVSEKDLPKNKLPALQELQYFPYTTHNILLSLLAMKLNASKDLELYFSSFVPSILKNNWQQLCQLSNEDNIKQFQAIRKSKEYENDLAKACEDKTVQDCYELIACTELEMLSPQQAPKKFVYGSTTIQKDGKNHSFSDCTETAILNFVCLALTKLGLYDYEKKCFLLNDDKLINQAVISLISKEAQLKRKQPTKITDEEIDNRKNNFFKNKDFTSFFMNDIWKDNREIHSIWAQLVSDKKVNGFKHVQDTFELKASPENFVAIFKYLFGSTSTSFEEICSMLDIYDSANKETFSLGTFEITNKYDGKAVWRLTPDFQPVIYAYFFGGSPGHTIFAIARNEGDATPFIESIFKRSTTNQLAMPLIYLYAYQNIQLDKRLELADFSAKPSEHKLAIFRNILYSHDFAQTRTNRMNLIEWLYKTEEKLSNKEILTAKLDEYKDSNGNTLLNCAIARDKDKIAKLLIDHGANINEKNNLGNTSLHNAIHKCKPEIVELLIKKDVRINEKNNDGSTPLHLAVSNGNPDIVELLIIKCCSINEKNNEGYTPLHFALMTNHQGIANILIEQIIKKDANLNEKSVIGITPLFVAIAQNQSDIAKTLIEQLIKNKTDLNESGYLAYTPLHFAFLKNQPDIAEILIKHLIKINADLNKKNEDDNTPLHLAIINNQPILAELLLKQLFLANASLNEKNKEGNTPLHLAIIHNRPVLAEILLKQLLLANASLNKKNNNNETPSYLARKKGYNGILKLLEEGMKQTK